ncbi:hypothetical protein BO71DRAFT_437620 [Aspergillus ellipticus CBS 707.79]|uniref:HTH CENPB-type domain-containing protein n=1 Tax=Aspergillus ellipticus CBS 707.79 TaxID=1448320 RepID=A0A319DNQ4_9EURO|nr:hypothetical protein BO71DRAFT_437620 [Aspergillus ellipticus CBS 707.79]
MPLQYHTDELKYNDAVRLYREKHASDNPISMQKLASDLGLTYSRLRRRLLGLPTRSTRTRVNLRLNKAQYEALFRHLDLLDRAGKPLPPRLVRSIAEDILQRGQSDPSQPRPRLSKMWAYRFMQHNQEFFKDKYGDRDMEDQGSADGVGGRRDE